MIKVAGLRRHRLPWPLVGGPQCPPHPFFRIDRVTSYTVCVEVSADGTCMAHVAELPGCAVLAVNLDRAMLKLPEEIARHRRWRQTHGVPAGTDEKIHLVLGEIVRDVQPWRSDATGALFHVDRRPLDDDEFAGRMRLLACARADLLRAVHAAPRGAFDDEIPGLPRTLRETLLHLAESEAWLLSRLGQEPPLHEPDPVRRLVDVRARTAAQLARFSPGDRDLVFVPSIHGSGASGEMWTQGKFLRRLLEHELLHLGDVEEALARWSSGSGFE